MLCAGNLKCPLVKAQNLHTCRAGSLREDKDRVATLQSSIYPALHLRIVAVGVYKVRIPYGNAVEWVSPDPLLGYYHNLWRDHHYAEKVQMALVVADYYRGCLKSLSRRVCKVEFYSGYMCYKPSGDALYKLVVAQFSLRCALEEGEVYCYAELPNYH